MRLHRSTRRAKMRRLLAAHDTNIGDRSGYVVTTPTGVTDLCRAPTRNIHKFCQRQRCLGECKLRPMQTRGPTPNGRYAKRSGGVLPGMNRDGGIISAHPTIFVPMQQPGEIITVLLRDGIPQSCPRPPRRRQKCQDKDAWSRRA